MLLFVKCFGAGINETLILVPESNVAWRMIREQVVHLRPLYVAKRFLFSGRELTDADDEKSLADLRIVKESTIQFFCASLDNMLPDGMPLRAPSIRRQPTAESIAHGDIIVVNLIQGRNLAARDDTGFSDPYCVFGAQGRTARSSVQVQTLNPTWNEMFVFLVDVLHADQTFSLLCFDKDDAEVDDPLGHAEIDLDTIVEDETSEHTLRLQGVESGEVSLSIRRVPLASAEARQVVDRLVTLSRPITLADFEVASSGLLTMEQVLGETPLIMLDDDSGVDLDPAEHRNLALRHVWSQVQTQQLRLQQERTLSKTARVLFSQRVAATLDLPTRHLWISDVPDAFCSSAQLTKVVQAAMESSSKIGLLKQLTFLPFAPVAVLSFSSVEAAVLCMISLASSKALKGASFVFGPAFGEAESSSICGIVQFSGPHDPESINKESIKFQNGWLSMNSAENGYLSLSNLFKRMNSEQAFTPVKKPRRLTGNVVEFRIPVDTLAYEQRGPWSWSIIDQTSGQLWLFQTASTDATAAQRWQTALVAPRQAVSIQNPSGDRCGKCETSPLVCYTTDNGSTDCLQCTRNKVQQQLDHNMIDAINQDYSAQDLKDLLPSEAFSAFLEASFKNLVDSSSDFVRCPQCQTAIAVPEQLEDQVLVASPEFQALDTLTGVNQIPLDQAAKLHYLQNRCKCVGAASACGADFCRLCSAMPYHSGFDCDGFATYFSLPKCIYCSSAIDDSAQLVVDSEHVSNICNSESCSAKNLYRCDKSLDCGHACMGHKGEARCGPCLTEDCEIGAEQRASAKITQVHSDECSICCTEDLSQAPTVELACHHIFHFQCIKTRLENGWSGATIDFAFVNCPLCATAITSSHLIALKSLLEPFEVLKKRVTLRALERLKFEGLDRSKALTNKSSAYYHDPKALALQSYVFFQCHLCKNPYFGGARQCGPNQDQREVKKEELICIGCQKVESMEACPTHGTDWLAFKCRFCCSTAVWHCWNTVHFCDSCHSNWSNLVEYNSGTNKKRLWEYSTCSSLEKRCKAMAANSSFASDADREKACARLVSDPSNCPLKVRHPPSGIEFGIGCGLCRGAESNAPVASSASVANEENEDEAAALAAIQEAEAAKALAEKQAAEAKQAADDLQRAKFSTFMKAAELVLESDGQVVRTECVGDQIDPKLVCQMPSMKLQVRVTAVPKQSETKIFDPFVGNRFTNGGVCIGGIFRSPYPSFDTSKVTLVLHVINSETGEVSDPIVHKSAIMSQLQSAKESGAIVCLYTVGGASASVDNDSSDLKQSDQQSVHSHHSKSSMQQEDEIDSNSEHSDESSRHESDVSSEHDSDQSESEASGNSWREYLVAFLDSAGASQSVCLLDLQSSYALCGRLNGDATNVELFENCASNDEVASITCALKLPITLRLASSGGSNNPQKCSISLNGFGEAVKFCSRGFNCFQLTLPSASCDRFDVLSSASFDTSVQDSAVSSLISWMESHSSTPNTLVILETLEDAANQMTSTAHQVIKSCLGCTQIERLGSQDAYIVAAAIQSSGTPLLLLEKIGHGGTTLDLQLSLFDPSLVSHRTERLWSSVFSNGTWQASDPRTTSVELHIQSPAFDDDMSEIAASTERLRIGLMPEDQMKLSGSVTMTEAECSAAVQLVPAASEFTAFACSEVYFPVYRHSLPASGPDALITFCAQAECDVMIGLSANVQSSFFSSYYRTGMVVVEIGGSSNSTSRLLGFQSCELATASTPSICDASLPLHFWIWIQGTRLRVGSGEIPGQHQLLETSALAVQPSLIAFGARSVDVKYSNVVISDGSDIAVHTADVEVPTSLVLEPVDPDEIKFNAKLKAPCDLLSSSDDHVVWSDKWISSSPGTVYITFQARGNAAALVCLAQNQASGKVKPGASECIQVQIGGGTFGDMCGVSSLRAGCARSADFRNLFENNGSAEIKQSVFTSEKRVWCWIRLSGDREKCALDAGLGLEFGKNMLMQHSFRNDDLAQSLSCVSLASIGTMQFFNVRVTDSPDAHIPLPMNAETDEFDSNESLDLPSMVVPLQKLRCNGFIPFTYQMWSPIQCPPDDIYVSFQLRGSSHACISLCEDVFPLPFRALVCSMNVDGNHCRISLRSDNVISHEYKKGPVEYSWKWFWIRFEGNRNRISFGRGKVFGEDSLGDSNLEYQNIRYKPRFIAFQGGTTENLSEYQHILVSDSALSHFKSTPESALEPFKARFITPAATNQPVVLSACALSAAAWSESVEFRNCGGIYVGGFGTGNAYGVAQLQQPTLLLTILSPAGKIEHELRVLLWQADVDNDALQALANAAAGSYICACSIVPPGSDRNGPALSTALGQAFSSLGSQRSAEISMSAAWSFVACKGGSCQETLDQSKIAEASISAPVSLHLNIQSHPYEIEISCSLALVGYRAPPDEDSGVEAPRGFQPINQFPNTTGINFALLKEIVPGKFKITSAAFNTADNYAANAEVQTWLDSVALTEQNAGAILIGAVCGDCLGNRSGTWSDVIDSLGVSKFKNYAEYRQAFVFISRLNQRVHDSTAKIRGECLFQQIRINSCNEPIKIDYKLIENSTSDSANQLDLATSQTTESMQAILPLQYYSPSVWAQRLEFDSWDSVPAECWKSFLFTAEVAVESDLIVGFGSSPKDEFKRYPVVHFGRLCFKSPQSCSITIGGSHGFIAPGSKTFPTADAALRFSPIRRQRVWVWLRPDGFLLAGTGRQVGLNVVSIAYLPSVLLPSFCEARFLYVSTVSSNGMLFGKTISPCDSIEKHQGFSWFHPEETPFQSSFTSTLRTGEFVHWPSCWSLPFTDAHTSALLTFKAEAASSLLVSLSMLNGVTRPSSMSYSAFDIVVGDRNGTSSYIRFGGKSIAAKMHHDNPLSSEQARSFWILVRTGPLCNALVVGHGDECNSESVIMHAVLDCGEIPLHPKYFSFASNSASCIRVSDIVVSSGDAFTQFDCQKSTDIKRELCSKCKEQGEESMIVRVDEPYLLSAESPKFGCDVCHDSCSGTSFHCVQCQTDRCLKCQTKVAVKVCSFVKTGAKFVDQPVFYCNTCGFTEEAGKGVCAECATHCHADHDVTEGKALAEDVGFYCDCAADKSDAFHVKATEASIATAADGTNVVASDELSVEQCANVTLSCSFDTYLFIPSCWRTSSPCAMEMTFDAISASDSFCILLFDSRTKSSQVTAGYGVSAQFHNSSQAAYLRGRSATSGYPQQLGSDSDYSGAAFQLHKRLSFWVRVSRSMIQVGMGSTPGENRMLSADAEAINSVFGENAWTDSFRIDQATLTCASEGTVSFSNVRVRDLDPELIEEAPPEQQPCCTFLKTGPVFKRVRYFYCDTCPMNESNGEGVCVPCAQTCHVGHDLREQSVGMGFYCDCATNKVSHGEPCKLNVLPEAAAAAPAPVTTKLSTPSPVSTHDSADGYQYYLLKLMKSRNNYSSLYFYRPRFLVQSRQAFPVAASCESGRTYSHLQQCLDGVGDFSVDINGGFGLVLFQFARPMPINHYELVTCEESDSYDVTQYALYGASSPAALANPDPESQRLWTLLDDVNEIAPPMRRRSGYGLRPIKSGADAAAERRAVMSLRHRIEEQPFASLLTNKAFSRLRIDDRLCFSIQPSTGTVWVSHNGSIRTPLLCDPSVFSTPQRLVLSLLSDGTAAHSHRISCAAVSAPSILKSNFDSLLISSSSKASAPAEYEISPQLFDEDEVEKYRSALPADALRVVSVPVPDKAVVRKARSLMSDAAPEVAAPSFDNVDSSTGSITCGPDAAIHVLWPQQSVPLQARTFEFWLQMSAIYMSDSASEKIFVTANNTLFHSSVMRVCILRRGRAQIELAGLFDPVVISLRNSTKNMLAAHWHHLAFVVDANSLLVYQNGDLIHQCVVGDDEVQAQSALSASAPLTVGSSCVGGPSCGLFGHVSEFRVWSEALDGKCIADRMKRRCDGSEDHLIVCLPLNERVSGVEPTLLSNLATQRIDAASAVFVPKAKSTFPPVSHAELSKLRALHTRAVAASAASGNTEAFQQATHNSNGVLQFCAPNAFLQLRNTLGSNGGGMYLNDYTLTFEFLFDRALPAGSTLILYQPDTSFMIPTSAFSIDHNGATRVGDELGSAVDLQPNVWHHFGASVSTGNGAHGQNLGSVLFTLDGIKVMGFVHSADIDISRDYGYAMRGDCALLMVQSELAAPEPINFYVNALKLENVARSAPQLNSAAALSLADILEAVAAPVKYNMVASLPAGCLPVDGQIEDFHLGGAQIAQYCALSVPNPLVLDASPPLRSWTIVMDFKIMSAPRVDAALLQTNAADEMLLGVTPEGTLFVKGRSQSTGVKFKFGSMFQRLTVRSDKCGVIDAFIDGKAALRTAAFMGDSIRSLLDSRVLVFHHSDSSFRQGGVIRGLEIYATALSNADIMNAL